ncbi:twin-arginine translocase subunit TatC [Caldichromatium japonicum]|uniref:Sec-independent protein translocase protein TatC n=1 Tax=Caldichromatium japonicum TaxID=2699430 RepID=A0A6G7VCU6_9GAMM|nr:twin-arginine translocase subunit TatC [Caldichromatium japonicum]QIK37879.1 twin-arginine translocase subunit TatC [Caldichromatium japonicum]
MSSLIQPHDPEAEQPFIAHLAELRARIIRMLIAVGIVVLALLPFANPLYGYVAAPLLAKLPTGNTMIATQVASPLLAPLKLSLIAAVFLAMPYLLYQVWAFVAPGLYQHEKRLALPLLVSSILLFYLGMAFAYYIVFPLIFAFLTATTPPGVEMMTDISAYLDFVLTLFFAFGVAFEVPIATVLLVAIGVVTPEGLKQKRPYVIVAAFVIGMLLTPPDVISQTLLAVPMWMLFELGLLASRLLVKRGSEDDQGPRPPAVQTPQPSPTPAPSAAAWGMAGASERETKHARGERDAALATDAAPSAPIDPVEDKIRRANLLRDLGNELAARQLLYQVLEEGDANQRQVARNILGQLDQSV